MSKDVDITSMPRWTVIPLVFITCLALAAIIVCAVRVVGHHCPFGCKEDEPRLYSRQRRSGIVRPHNESDDTMALAAIRPPPPAYANTHPPQYGALFMAADALERGVYRGNS
jgi:hypothetical protein